MASAPDSGPAPAAAGSAPEDSVWLARIRRPQGRKGEVFADLLTDFPERFAERKRLWLLAELSSAKPGPVSGHDFSRAVNATDSTGALEAAEKLGVSGETGGKLPSAAKAIPDSIGLARGLKPPSPSASRFSAACLAPEKPARSPASNSPYEVELINHWPHKGGIVLHFAGVDSISEAETLKGLIVAIPRSERAALAEDEVYIGDLIGCALADVAGAEPVVVGEIEGVNRTAGPVALLVVRGAAGEVLVPFAKSYLRKIDLQAKRVEMALPEGLVDLNAPGESPKRVGLDKAGN